MNPLLRYSMARLALFVVSLGLLVWAGAGQLWAIIGAAVISMLVSYVLLRGLRDQVALQVADRVARRTGQRPGPGVDEQTEDAELDELDARKPAPRDSARSAATD